jgi:hypothetical protein
MTGTSGSRWNLLYIYVGLAFACLGGLVAVANERWEHWPKPEVKKEATAPN